LYRFWNRNMSRIVPPGRLKPFIIIIIIIIIILITFFRDMF